jgi:hypothetical protein
MIGSQGARWDIPRKRLSLRVCIWLSKEASKGLGEKRNCGGREKRWIIYGAWTMRGQIRKEARLLDRKIAQDWLLRVRA